MARSVELVAQRRRVELHLKAQSTAVKAQAVSGRPARMGGAQEGQGARERRACVLENETKRP
jgi:hypothetical protein